MERELREQAEVARSFEALVGAIRGAVGDDSIEDVEATLEGSLLMPDFGQVKAKLRQHMDLATRWEHVVEEALLTLDEIERRARLRRFDPERWDMRRDAFAAAFQRDPNAASAEWIAAYADALAHWELDFCERLANEPFPLPTRAAPIQELLIKATTAIRTERFADAEPLLEYLVDSKHRDLPPLRDETRALLLVMLGRIEICDVGQPEEALAHLSEAADLAPADGRTRAALGDYHRALGDLDKADAEYREAIGISPDNPQGYVGLGLVAEDRGWWDEADDWYEQAMPQLSDADAVYQFRRALRALRAPASGNVYLELARSVRKVDSEVALDALDRALELGVNQTGIYPDRVAHKLRGRVLEKLGRTDEAAAAFFEAGWRFHSANELVVAAECLESADRLSPGDPETLRYWADTLLVLSQRDEPPYVETEPLERALNVWRDGFEASGIPDADSSWTYVSRGRMADRLALVRIDERWELEWEAITYVERALVRHEAEPFRWAMLAGFFRALDLQVNALHAATRALELDPNEPSAVEEYAATNANLGRLEEAEQAIDRRRATDTYPWLDAVKAYTLVYRNQAAEALPLLDELVATTPDDPWYRELRGLCYDMLGDTERAEADNGFLWDRRSDISAPNDLSRVAFAGSYLGEHEEALAIFEDLLEDPSQESNARRGILLTRLASGDLRGAEDELATLLDSAANGADLRSLVDVDFARLVRTPGSHDREIASFIDQQTPRVLARSAELDQLPPPEEELERILDEEEGRQGWAWVGAKAALARLHGAAGRNEEAAATYRLLSDDRERFPEASVALLALTGEEVAPAQAGLGPSAPLAEA